MKDFPIVWLLVNTKTGKVILALLVGYIVIYIVGWWLLPILTALIGGVLLNDYAVRKVNKKKSEMVAGICFLAFALLFTLFYVFHANRERYFPKDSSPEPMETEEVAEEDTSTWEPPGDTAIFSEPVKTKAVKSVKSTTATSSRSYSSGSDDGMRGFDPASEDDMDDNGMSRYMEANDDEGWD